MVESGGNSSESIVETISKVEQWAKDVKFCPSDKFADERGNWNNYRTSNVRGVLSDMANAVFAGKVCCHIPLTLLPATETELMALYRTLFLSSPVTSTESTMTTSRTTTAGFGLQRRGIVVARISATFAV